MQARRLIVISGEQQHCLIQAKKLVSDLPTAKVIDDTVAIKQVLGKEHFAVIYNCFRGFDPDLLGAIGGTIVAGGTLLLLTPPLDEWHTFCDPFNDRIANWPYTAGDLSGLFIRRFVRLLRAVKKEPGFVTLLPADTRQEIPPILSPVTPSHPIDFKTVDQVNALNTLLATTRTCEDQQETATIVLEADRGRGKSAVLGMLASALQNHAVKINAAKILVTAPSRKTADVIFRHAGKAGTENENLSFIAPDKLCHEYPPADLLLVDEAAAIPSSLLTKILKHYQQIVFATTVHGYEGTGRGFAIRFKKQLDSIAPNWQNITLRQPIRYAENDPLEAFLFDSLLLDAKPVDAGLLDSFSLQTCSYEKISSKQLYQNETLLREIFGLLVLAHYQTRPADLRHLLDGVDVSISAIKWQGHVIATALTVLEGGFDKQLAHEIHYGMRRPRGHLVPQSLAVHAGIADAPIYRTERIMRIVVHPAVQRRGVASLLLNHIRKDAQADYLSSSFGATYQLLEFWRKQQFQVVRMGLSRDASSGCHSVIVMHVLSSQGKSLFQRAQNQFQRYFPILLSEPLKDLEIELIQLINSENSSVVEAEASDETDLNAQDHTDIQSFAFGKRGYESCMLALQKLVRSISNDQLVWQSLTADKQKLLMLKIIEQQSWSFVARETSLTGRKEVLSKLRMIIQEIVEIF